MIREINEIRERYFRLKSNISIIKDSSGIENINLIINTLKEYIDNPKVDLGYLIDNSSGQRKQVLKWIAGVAR